MNSLAVVQSIAGSIHLNLLISFPSWYVQHEYEQRHNSGVPGESIASSHTHMSTVESMEDVQTEIYNFDNAVSGRFDARISVYSVQYKPYC